MALTQVEIQITDASRDTVFMYVNRLVGEYKVSSRALGGFRGRTQELKGRLCTGWIDLSKEDIHYRITLIEQFEVVERRKNLL